MTRAIEMKGYTFRYPGTEVSVLDGCALSLDFGEFVVLSGESGAGKSTLIASLIGSGTNLLHGRTEGRILINGKDTEGLRISAIARDIGSVLQDADSQIVHASVEDEIAFGPENFGMQPDEIEGRVAGVLEMMRLRRGALTRTLSGGQKQRLITAATLAMGQKILVFDEPLANLDQSSAHELMYLLQGLAHEKGYAVLFVEHRLDMVLPYADRLLHLADGKCREVDIAGHLPGQKQIPSLRAPSTPSAEPQPRPLQAQPSSSQTLQAPFSKSHIDVENLAWRAGERDILKDISFSIPKGSRFVILGENGSGKTTLLRLIARLLRPTSGRVTQHISSGLGEKPSPAWFDSVGYVFQNPNYQLFMSRVVDEVAFGARSEEDAENALRVYGFDELRDRHPQTLSEGQKRRLGIAAIAARAPELLILDEPTVGQDRANLLRVIDALNAMNRERGCTLVTVTHDAYCAAALADLAIVIRAGVVSAVGGTEVVADYFQKKTDKDVINT